MRGVDFAADLVILAFLFQSGDLGFQCFQAILEVGYAVP
jgi:hypothetical protein